jgi:predicted AlkP superfamily pyrophosphatase or phosphodiesterase
MSLGFKPWKKFGCCCAWFLLIGVFSVYSAQPAKAKPEYILFLTADGFRTDYLDWYKPPVLTQLAAEGVRVLHPQNVFPTQTTPNMTALVTGALPRTSGIAANNQYVAELDEIMQSPRDNKAETIAETLGKAGWRTAAVNHFMLKGRGARFYRTVGYDKSEETTEAILDLIKNQDAHFIAAIYGETDHAGHKHGPESKEVKDAVLSIDKAVGKLIEALKAQGIYERALITFTADHGMSAYEKKEASREPAEALRRAGFKVATSEGTLKPETDIVVLDAGVRLVYFRSRAGPEARTKAAKVLTEIKGVEVLNRQRLDALGCHNNRSGDLVVSPLPGYCISGAGQSGGLHGRFSENNPILLFHGPGVKPGLSVDQARTIDVVPTILQMAGIAPAATVDGKPITLGP